MGALWRHQRFGHQARAEPRPLGQLQGHGALGILGKIFFWGGMVLLKKQLKLLGTLKILGKNF